MRGSRGSTSSVAAPAAESASATTKNSMREVFMSAHLHACLAEPHDLLRGLVDGFDANQQRLLRVEPRSRRAGHTPLERGLATCGQPLDACRRFLRHALRARAANHEDSEVVEIPGTCVCDRQLELDTLLGLAGRNHAM